MLIAVWIGVYVGLITPGNLIGSFVNLIYAIVVIAFLAIIGAVFLGMAVSHRILSVQAFTPFEEEMLKMRQEVRDLQVRVEAIGEKLGLPGSGRGKGP